MSKDHPILMSAPMVSATLADLKTQTRRVPTARNSVWGAGDWKHHGYDFHTAWVDGRLLHKGRYLHVPYWHLADGRERWAGAADRLYCRYEVGDRLWVKETFQAARGGYRYRADHPGLTTTRPWKPSIFMPRAASRITLEVVSVRAERLQDITEADAIAEGIEGRWHPEDPRCWTWKDYERSKLFKSKSFEGYFHYGSAVTPISTYAGLWDSINGDGAWARNDWVWRIEFKRVEQTTEPMARKG